MSAYPPRRKKYTGDAETYEPPLKLRTCLGLTCQKKIESRYPGLCTACKKGLGQAWESPVPEYLGPSGNGGARHSTG